MALDTADSSSLRARLSAFQAPRLGRSIGQLASTFPPYFALLVAMYALRLRAPWLALALAAPAAGLTLRIFIIQHDCGHGAFFRSRTANDWLGRFCSLMTLTPYANWRRQHAMHHACWNDLDARAEGVDIYSTCLTVAEYRARSALRRWWSRVVRHPLVAQVLLPPLVFLFVYRVPIETPRSWRRERASVLLTDLALGAVFATLVWLLGARSVAMVQLPTVALAAIIGMWLFSVQHRFEHAVWARRERWTVENAALFGSSYLRLPAVLQWFSGNIGFHHIHHLLPRVPNYRLASCHRVCAALTGGIRPLSLREALQAPAYALWDEEQERMVRFSDLRRRVRPNEGEST